MMEIMDGIAAWINNFVASEWMGFLSNLFSSIAYSAIGFILGYLFLDRWINPRLYGGSTVQVIWNGRKYPPRDVHWRTAKDIAEDEGKLSVFLKGVVSPKAWLHYDLVVDGRENGMLVEHSEKKYRLGRRTDYIITLDKNVKGDELKGWVVRVVRKEANDQVDLADQGKLDELDRAAPSLENGMLVEQSEKQKRPGKGSDYTITLNKNVKPGDELQKWLAHVVHEDAHDQVDKADEEKFDELARVALSPENVEMLIDEDNEPLRYFLGLAAPYAKIDVATVAGAKKSGLLQIDKKSKTVTINISAVDVKEKGEA